MASGGGLGVGTRDACADGGGHGRFGESIECLRVARLLRTKREESQDLGKIAIPSWTLPPEAQGASFGFTAPMRWIHSSPKPNVLQTCYRNLLISQKVRSTVSKGVFTEMLGLLNAQIVDMSQ